MINQLPFKKLNDNAVLPVRGSVSAAAVDLYSVEEITIAPQSFATIGTGIAVAIPEGYYGRIAGRSGFASKLGINTLGGVVDSDYRGEIKCVLANHGSGNFEIKIGDRIAQFIIEAIITPEPVLVDELPETARGESAFGSTGVN